MSEMLLATSSTGLVHILLNKILLDKIQKAGIEENSKKKGKEGGRCVRGRRGERGEGQNMPSCPWGQLTITTAV